MYSIKLFFGLLVNEEFANHLSKVNPDLLALFIQNKEDYLSDITVENMRFIGKYIDKAVDLTSLELLQLNIYSIVKRILPEYTCENNPLILFPLQDSK